MNLQNEIRKLLDVRKARAAHQAAIAVQLLDPTAKWHRINYILNNPDTSNPRHRRIVELFGIAQSRKDAGDFKGLA